MIKQKQNEISVYLSKEEILKVKTFAKNKGLNMSSLLRFLLFREMKTEASVNGEISQYEKSS